MLLTLRPTWTFSYLKLTTVPTLGELFKSDLDADLFADMVRVLVATWPQETGQSDDDQHLDQHRQFAADVLVALSATSRLALVLDFLDNNQRETLESLVTLLATPPLDARHAALTTTFRLRR